METEATSMVEEVTKSELMGLASWNERRTAEQLMDFISRREAEIFATEPE
jgi:hypothetical protein